MSESRDGQLELVYVSASRIPTEKAHGLQTVKMCEAFARNGCAVTLLHPWRKQEDPDLRGVDVHQFYGVETMFNVEQIGNVQVTGLHRFLPGPLFVAVFTLHALLWGLYAAILARRRRADLYYTRSIHVAFWLTRLGLDTILEAHVVPKRLQRHLLRWVTVSRHLRQVVVLTPFIQEAFVEIGFPERRVKVDPDAADLSMFRDLPAPEECRRRLGLPKDREIIGYIGRSRTRGMEKGVPELIGAMPEVSRRRSSTPPLLLCVGGPMDAAAEYRSLAEELGVSGEAVRFYDRVPHSEIPLWIRACDVATIPWTWTEFSAYFTSPLKLFEYMAAGVPIVASNLPSIREILTHQQNALLAAPGDSDDLAAKICDLLDEPERAARLAARASTDVERYSWVRRAERILADVSG